MENSYLVHIHRTVDVDSTVAVMAKSSQEAGEIALQASLQDGNCTYEYDAHMASIDVQPTTVGEYRKIIEYARLRKEFRIKHDIHGDINL